jgi:dolichol-phosphate mannosyltransferase
MVNKNIILSIVVPCYNEEKTLQLCIDRLLQLKGDRILLEIVIVDDCSSDSSLSIARQSAAINPEVRVFHHEKNQGKGAALRTGFKTVTGDFVAVQDADLEYNPQELLTLIVPLVNDEADVVFGSRFCSAGTHRVLYFWHSIGNRFLTLLSNMFTDLNLTDMETCYKIFRRTVIQSIDIKENRFGFEPEIVAKVAQMRLRIYETGISYYGRTYAEGKKIGFKDAVRAFYCIVRYNAPSAPVPIQFLFYLTIGGAAAIFNILSFMGLMALGAGVISSALIAFFSAAILNYYLCIIILFRHKIRWNAFSEILLYFVMVSVVAVVDIAITRTFITAGLSAILSKSIASACCLVLNYIGRRFFIFPEPTAGPWK